MIMKKILQFFIIVFIIMVVVGLARGKGRTKARSYETVREDKKLTRLNNMADNYEKDPENSGMTEDDYMYSCYVTDREYKGYNLKKAVSFYTTCDIRGIKDETGRKNILKIEEIFGDMGDVENFDTEAFYALGEKMSNITAARKRIEKIK